MKFKISLIKKVESQNGGSLNSDRNTKSIDGNTAPPPYSRKRKVMKHHQLHHLFHIQQHQITNLLYSLKNYNFKLPSTYYLYFILSKYSYKILDLYIFHMRSVIQNYNSIGMILILHVNITFNS